MEVEGQNSDAILQRYQEIGEELQSEGYDSLVLDTDSDEHFSNNKEFQGAYKQFLHDRQGPEVELHGKTLRSVESPYSEATKDFFRNYVESISY